MALTREPAVDTVYDFFANGGSQAYVIRLIAANVQVAGVTIDGKLNVTAKNAGDWANTYAVSTRVSTFDATRFTLTVLQVQNNIENVAEVFPNLSMDPNDARFCNEYRVESIHAGGCKPRRRRNDTTYRHRNPVTNTG